MTNSEITGSFFSPTKTTSLKDKVHDQILELIIKNASAEEQVMNEKRLAEMLDVSKLTVREALIMLCSEGVLKNIPRYGYLVIQIQDRDMQDAIWLRKLLEKEALKCSFPQIGSDEMESLKRQIDNASKKKHVDVWTVWNDNEEFHLLLASFAGNHVLESHLKSCLDMLKRFYAQNYWRKKNTLEDSIFSDPHKNIYDQLINRNLSKCLDLLENDIDSGM